MCLHLLDGFVSSSCTGSISTLWRKMLEKFTLLLSEILVGTRSQEQVAECLNIMITRSLLPSTFNLDLFFFHIVQCICSNILENRH